MRPHLIIDFTSRNIFALIADGKGGTIPCTFKKHGMRSRYFSAQIWLDPERYRKTDEKWLSELNTLISENQGKTFFPGKAAGWLRNDDLGETEGVLPVRHPLYALSSFGVPEESAEGLGMADIASALLGFVLQPLAKSLSDRGLDPSHLDVVAITASYLSRLAQGVLCKTLRRMAFRRISVLHHGAALAMWGLPSAHEVGVIHADENCLHVGKIGITRKSGNTDMTLLASRSLESLGWHALIRELVSDFHETGFSERGGKGLQAHLDRILPGLFGGILPPNLSPKQKPLTYGVLAEKLAGNTGRYLREEVSGRLMPLLQELGFKKNTQIITAGLFFMSGRFEALILEGLERNQPFRARRVPALERAAYGVAEMLRQVAGNPERTFRFRNRYGLRVSTNPGNSVELIPASLFPLGPGQRRIFRQALALSGPEGKPRSELLAADILWGNNPIPRYDTSLCTLTYDVTADDIRDDSKLELVFDLKGISDGGMKGSVRSKFGKHKPQIKKLRYPDPLSKASLR